MNTIHGRTCRHPGWLRLTAVSLMCLSVHVIDARAQAINNLGAPAHANVNPWGPAAASIILPQGGTPITFRSGVEGAGDLMIPGVLYKPSGNAKGAVVIVSGSYGWSNDREGHYARAMSSAGFAVLAIETLSPRGVTNAGIDIAAASMFDQLRDAYAARRVLVEAGYRPDRMAIMGVGRGGTIALMAADKSFGLPQGEQGFSLAMAVTPSCLFQPRAPRPATGIFIGLAEKDSLNSTRSCEEFAAASTAAGAKVVSKIYAGTASGFDGEPIVNRLVHDLRVENVSGCKVIVEPDGYLTYDGKKFTQAEFKELVGQLRKSCMGKGAFGYTNLTQKANLTLDVIDFLDSNFAQ